MTPPPQPEPPTPISPSSHPLEEILQYRFKDPSLLQQALTHPSYTTRNRPPNNQRLEFLGDAILQFTVSAWLYQKLPRATEGQLTATRAALVNRQRLENWARTLHLDQYIFVGKSAAPGRLTPTIIADACEAILGALYLDAGLQITQQIILDYYQTQCPDICALSLRSQNPKGTLQEWLQHQGHPPPVYRLINVQGPPHAATYTVEVQFQGGTATATASSKKKAEVEAATIAIRSLKIID